MYSRKGGGGGVRFTWFDCKLQPILCLHVSPVHKLDMHMVASTTLANKRVSMAMLMVANTRHCHTVSNHCEDLQKVPNCNTYQIQVK